MWGGGRCLPRGAGDRGGGDGAVCGAELGPAHAWGWLDEPVRVGVWAAAGMAVLLLMLPRRASAAVLLVALGGTWPC